MENSFIFKELKTEFQKYSNENNQISEIQAQRASWKFGIYPSTSQIFEIHSCASEENCLHNLSFHEFCLLIATIKSDVDMNNQTTKFKIKRMNTSDKVKSRWDVFLGGACNPTTWRFDVAIPFLKEKNITFYNPQVSQCDPSLIEIEEKAKETAKVQLFVLDIYRTRGIASLVEAAYLSGQGRNLVLVVPAERPTTVKEVDVKEIDENEFQSINRSYLFIADLVQRQGIPLFTSVADALKATRVSLISNTMVQDLTDIDHVIPVKHAYVNVSAVLRNLQNTFNDYDPLKLGVITITDVKKALSTIFECEVNPLSLLKEAFSFADFCIEYSILLIYSIYRHQETIRSHSVTNFNTRSTSLENISNSDNTYSIRSAINIKEHVITPQHEEPKLSLKENGIIKKSLCRCLLHNKTVCMTRLMKWPFSKISTISGETADQQNFHVSVRLVPRTLISEEKYDIFLGGTCGNSDWREKIAIPILKEAGCRFYDPKASNSLWSRRLLPIEAKAREQSKILVYVITCECTSTAALVEAAHYIGHERKVLLCVQLLSSMCSPPLTPMGLLLQSSCSFPSSTITNHLKSSFFSMHHTDSSTTGYHSNSDTSGILNNVSQFSLPPVSNKLSISDSGHLGSVEDIVDLSMSFNNISRINPLPSVACKDHNRGRKYLLDLAMRNKVPIFSTIEETIRQAVEWSHNHTPNYNWAQKYNP